MWLDPPHSACYPCANVHTVFQYDTVCIHNYALSTFHIFFNLEWILCISLLVERMECSPLGCIRRSCQHSSILGSQDGVPAPRLIQRWVHHAAFGSSGRSCWSGAAGHWWVQVGPHCSYQGVCGWTCRCLAKSSIGPVVGCAMWGACDRCVWAWAGLRPVHWLMAASWYTYRWQVSESTLFSSFNTLSPDVMCECDLHVWMWFACTFPSPFTLGLVSCCVSCRRTWHL